MNFWYNRCKGKARKPSKTLHLELREMYKRHLNQVNLLDDPEMFGGIKLSKENQWVKLAKMIPWGKLEEKYAEQFSAVKGNPACSFRVALGSLIIKETYQFSDEATVEHITMNPYLQYFIGLREYTSAEPFNACQMTRFRQRITPEMMSEINDIIIGRPRAEDNKENDHQDGKGTGSEVGSGEAQQSDKTEENIKGTLILDATCAPQNIRFPTDASLLNEARENSEQIIDELHAAGHTNGGKKPRTYREKARKEYNNYSKDRKKNAKKTRKCIRQQLGYLKRNLKTIEGIIQAHPDSMQDVSQLLRERYPILIMLYEQQKEMYDSGTHRISDRIVSLSQWWVRPIVRGKQKADTEFGAKVEMSDVDGYLRIEEIRWEAFNESTTLIESVENFRKAYGHYPERVLADKIFRTRENLRYCKEHGIHMNGPKLGKPVQDQEQRKLELKQEWLESGERGDIERRFGIGKRCYSLGQIMAKLKETSETTIHLSVLVLNLQKRLRLLLTFFQKMLYPRIWKVCFCVLGV